jgi:hypothetical protein
MNIMGTRNNEYTNGMAAGLVYGLLGITSLFSLGSQLIDKSYEKQENQEKQKSSMVHQYVDTNQDGQYDLYRFIQNGPVESTYVDKDGDGKADSVIVEDKSRIHSGSLETELTKEQTQREFRVGDIEHITL